MECIYDVYTERAVPAERSGGVQVRVQHRARQVRGRLVAHAARTTVRDHFTILNAHSETLIEPLPRRTRNLSLTLKYSLTVIFFMVIRGHL